MYQVVVFFAVALVCAGCKGASIKQIKILQDVDNNIAPNIIQAKQSTKKFLNLGRRPKAYSIHEPGTTLELTCEALGSPAPTVHWLRNDAPVYEFDSESNEIIDTNPSSLARISSTLLVTRTDKPTQYTCLVTAGLKTTSASTIVYSSGGTTDFTERVKLSPLEPRIVVYYKVYFDTIGNSIVLPCKAKGHPRPNVAWRDSKGKVINNDQRMKVIRSGELVISSLRWSDMGEYSCFATNLFGSQQIRTFVYPARAG